MAGKSAFQEDLARYAGRFRWTDGGLWAIGAYRLGRKILAIRNDRVRRLLFALFLPFSCLVQTVTRNSVNATAQIGAGFRIADGGMIVLDANTVIGRNCTVRRGVTIGNGRGDGPAPTVGDDVEFGAYAQALGGIHIGDGAKIASMAVVLRDVPPGSIAIGVPAKILTGSKVGAQQGTTI